MAETNTLVIVLSGAVKDAGGTRAFAREHKLPPYAVYRALEGGHFSDRMLAAIGLERVVITSIRRKQ